MASIGQLKNVFAFDLNRDSDGDGWSDIYELSHPYTGTNPLGVNPSPFNADTDGDGIADGQETGSSAWLADTDGDGFKDGEDRWPQDGRRGDYIPPKFYAVTDLSAYLPDGHPAKDLEPEHITIDDDHNVSWVARDPDTVLAEFTDTIPPGGGDGVRTQKVAGPTHHVVHWKAADGTISTETLVDRQETVFSISGGLQTTAIDTLSRTIAGVTTGTAGPKGAYGSFQADLFTKYNSGVIYFHGARVLRGLTAAGADGLAVPEALSPYVAGDLTSMTETVDQALFYPTADKPAWDHINDAFLDDGPALGTNVEANSRKGNVAGTVSYVTSASGGGRQQRWRAFRNSTTNWLPESLRRDDLKPQFSAMSDNGSVVVGYKSDGETPVDIPRRILWFPDPANPTGPDLTADIGSDLDAIAVNDSQDIIGGYGASAYYYSSGQITPFRDLIPAVFRDQLAEVVPLHIGNRDSLAAFPVIVFGAYSLEGPSPGQWAYRRFLLEKDNNGELIIAQQVAHEGPEVAPQQINKNATGVSTAGGVPRFTGLVDWRYHGDHGWWRGFDPMMPGVLHQPGGLEDGPKTEPSKLAGFTRDDRHWASVTMGKQNTSIKVWFKDREYGRKAKLALAPGSSQFIDVSPKDMPLEPVAEGGEDTKQPGFIVPITITGKPAASDKPETATIELRSIDPRSQLLGKLTVMVLPEAVVDVAIHWVSAGPDLPDGSPHPTSNNPHLIGRDNSGDIIKWLNEVFGQAGVRFERNVQASGKKVVAYDPNGDKQLNSMRDEDPELKVLANSPALSGAKLNLVFLRKSLKVETGYLGNAKTGGWAPVEDGDGQLRGNKVYILTEWAGVDQFAFGNVMGVVGHEVGHALGLSTRVSYVPGQVRQADRYRHDFGIFPMGALAYAPAHHATEDVINRGLMFWSTSPNRWMRHEDWEMANTRARARFKK